MRRHLALASLLVLSGCGLHSPDISEVFDGPGEAENRKANPPTPPYTATMQIEFEIRRRIYCDLKAAVKHVNEYPQTLIYSSGKKQTLPMLPDNWVALISLSLQVDESSALSPGVTYNQTLRNAAAVFGVGSANTISVGQSFNLAFGGTLSSVATRIDKFNPTYSIGYLMEKPSKESVCNTDDTFVNPPRSSPFLIQSDLGIDRWLMGAMLTQSFLPAHPPIKMSSSAGSTPIGAKTAVPAAGGGDGAGGGAASGGGSDKGGGSSLGPLSVSLELKFVIVSSGSVTPTWKLLQVSADTNGTLFSTGRTRTHDLIITIGPPDANTTNAYIAQTIGSAINNRGL